MLFSKYDYNYEMEGFVLLKMYLEFIIKLSSSPLKGISELFSDCQNMWAKLK